MKDYVPPGAVKVKTQKEADKLMGKKKKKTELPDVKDQIAILTKSVVALKTRVDNLTNRCIVAEGVAAAAMDALYKAGLVKEKDESEGE